MLLEAILLICWTVDAPLTFVREFG